MAPSETRPTGKDDEACAPAHIDLPLLHRNRKRAPALDANPIRHACLCARGLFSLRHGRFSVPAGGRGAGAMGLAPPVAGPLLCWVHCRRSSPPSARRAGPSIPPGEATQVVLSKGATANAQCKTKG